MRCSRPGAAAELLTPGKHGTTFGGNPVCAAAALAVLRTIDEEELLSHAECVGKTLSAGIEELDHPLVDHVRGAGLLLGIVLTAGRGAGGGEMPRAEAGYLVNAAKPNVIRLAPPLILTEEQADGFVAALPAYSMRAIGSSEGAVNTVVRHFLRDDDVTPAEQAEILALAAESEEGAVRSASARGPARRRRDLREELDPHPFLVRNGHRAARRSRRGGRRAQIPSSAARRRCADTGRVLSRYVDAVVWRTFGQKRLEEMASGATIPDRQRAVRRIPSRARCWPICRR